MKTPSILAVLLPVMGVAQAPLAIDPSFQLLSPSLLQWMNQHPGHYQASDIVLRPNGNYLITSYGIYPMDPWVPPGGRSLIITPEGHHVPSAFENNAGGGRIQELPNGQYFIGRGRFNHDGTRDWGFNTARNEVNGAGEYHVNADGTVLCAGTFILYVPDTSGGYGLIRYDSTGRLDRTFTHRKASGVVNHIWPLRNGQFLLGGQMGGFDGRPTGCVVRIHPDGAIDTTFTFPYQGSARAMHELPDGRYLLSGYFGNFSSGGRDTLHLVRVFGDGSLDPGFDHRTAYRLVELSAMPAYAHVIVLGAIDEGRFLVGGSFTRVDGHVRTGIACVDTSGNLLHDCWASEGLRPTHYTSGGTFPQSWLANYKRLPDGSHWIMGEYKGIVDDVGAYPEQVVLSRLRVAHVGMEERRESMPRMEVWPNPGSEGFTVAWGHAGPAQLELRDAQGRLVRTVRVASSSHTVDASDLPAGLYLLRLVHGQGVHAAKWTKE